jgi:hypothetical protein
MESGWQDLLTTPKQNSANSWEGVVADAPADKGAAEDQGERTVAAKVSRAEINLILRDLDRALWVQQIICRLATKRFGPPDELTDLDLIAITDLDQLERVVDRLLDASSWQDLLDTP